jgi:hypothetical protein
MKSYLISLQAVRWTNHPNLGKDQITYVPNTTNTSTPAFKPVIISWNELVAVQNIINEAPG